MPAWHVASSINLLVPCVVCCTRSAAHAEKCARITHTSATVLASTVPAATCRTHLRYLGVAHNHQMPAIVFGACMHRSVQTLVQLVSALRDLRDSAVLRVPLPPGSSWHTASHSFQPIDCSHVGGAEPQHATCSKHASTGMWLYNRM